MQKQFLIFMFTSLIKNADYAFWKLKKKSANEYSDLNLSRFVKILFKAS